ncbi:MAG: alpha/beta fold hydrolase [Acidimicrobiia bacterium]|nr:alpha/beta fold hydrolase [Acidimicrobiia bacterium]
MTTPKLLLLHGLGATAGVWPAVVAAVAWPGPVSTPDLPGHGTAPWTGSYTLHALAGEIGGRLGDDEPVLIVGHSLGGAVGLELASGRYRPRVTGVVGIGIKTTWTDDDVAGMARVAERGVRWFDSRADAADRLRRQAGLDGLVDDDHPAVTSGVVEDPSGSGRWRPAQDPATFAQQPLDLAELLDAAQCPVILGAGEHDAMATRSELSAFTTEPRIAAGRGHNVHVEDPAWVAGLVAELAPTG